MKRRTAREKALQALFAIEIGKTDPDTAIDHVLDGAERDPYLTNLVHGVVKNKEQIDNVISELLEKWTLERLAAVDRNLLRMAAYELLFLRRKCLQKWPSMKPSKLPKFTAMKNQESLLMAFCQKSWKNIANNSQNQRSLT